MTTLRMGVEDELEGFPGFLGGHNQSHSVSPPQIHTHTPSTPSQ